MKSVRVARAALAAAVASVVMLPAQSAMAAVPPSDINYSFDGNLNDSAGGSTATESATCPPVGGAPCIDTSGFSSDGNGGYWTWTSSGPDGGGLRIVTNSPVTQTYTAILKFSFSGLSTSSGYSKIMDYKNRASDTGFYFRNNWIYFYNLGDRSEQTFSADEVIDLIIIRDGGTDTLTVYLRGADGSLGEPVISILDSGDQSVFADENPGSVIGLFFDDTNDEGAPGGRAYDFKMWQGVALTLDQIRELLGIATEQPEFDFDDYQLPGTRPTDVVAESLPNTGTNTLAPLAALGAVLVLAGAVTVSRSRRTLQS